MCMCTYICKYSPNSPKQGSDSKPRSPVFEAEAMAAAPGQNKLVLIVDRRLCLRVRFHLIIYFILCCDASSPEFHSLTAVSLSDHCLSERCDDRVTFFIFLRESRRQVRVDNLHRISLLRKKRFHPGPNPAIVSYSARR
jgi:hypothetical protein